MTMHKQRGKHKLWDNIVEFLCNLASFFLVCMLLIIVVDVLLRQLFDYPALATVSFDLVELFFVMVIFLTIPAVFLKDENIVVDVIDHLIPKRLVNCLRLLSNFLSLVFICVLLSQVMQPFLDSIRFGDHTLNLEIPKFIHAIPILISLICIIPVIIVVITRTLRAADQSKTTL